MTLLEVEDLRVSANGRTITTGTDFTVAPGETVGTDRVSLKQ